MSLQQVNLYQDELKSKKIEYSASTLLQITVLLMVVLSAATGFAKVRLQTHQSDLVERQQKQKTMTVELQKIQSELLLRKKDTTLTARILKKTNELTNKQKILHILNRDEFGNTIGFIEHVSGLARQRLEGLWLTKIRIAGGGTNIRLDGITSKSSLLPKYLQRLSAEKAFSGTEFESLLMARQENKKQWLNFSLLNQKDKMDTP